MQQTTPAPPHKLVITLLVITLLLLAWSAYYPKEWVTWALEVFPAVFGIALLGWSYRRFPLTPLVYILIAIHMAILIIGGHYTYAEVPIGNWARDQFDLSRNHYDRLGHIAQGFVPAMITREILLRCSPLRRGGWLFFLVLCVCLAVSAVYELLEWAVAEISEAGSQSFLGTQGDVWDTQKDMALCFFGAALALVTLSKLHNRQLDRRFPNLITLPRA